MLKEYEDHIISVTELHRPIYTVWANTWKGEDCIKESYWIDEHYLLALIHVKTCHHYDDNHDVFHCKSPGFYTKLLPVQFYEGNEVMPIEGENLLSIQHEKPTEEYCNKLAREYFKKKEKLLKVVKG